MKPTRWFRVAACFVDRASLVLILAAYLPLGIAYGILTPPFENLDEKEHFSLVRYLSDTGELPVGGSSDAVNYLYRQEPFQPPLYYALAAGVVKLFGLTHGDTNSYLVNNKFAIYGESSHPYNRNFLYHNPTAEAFPWQGALLTLHVLRILSTLLGLVTVLGVYRIARLTMPATPAIAPVAAALTAFNPKFLAVSSSVTNDTLVIAASTLAVWVALLVLRKGLSWPRTLLLGALVAVATMSKLSGAMALGLVALLFLWLGWRQPRWWPLLAHGGVIVAMVGTASGWWLWRNWQLYGDPTGLAPMLDMVGRRDSFIYPLQELGRTFLTFWGETVAAFFSPSFYWLVSTISALALGGFLWTIWRWRRRGEGVLSGWSLALLALWLLMVIVGWARWDAMTAAPHGRLLFPAIASSSVILAVGLVSPLPRSWRPWSATAWVLLLLGIAVYALQVELAAFFAPPPVYAEASPPAITHKLDAQFGEDIRVIGYEATISGEPPALELTLYWQANRQIQEDYIFAVQLHQATPSSRGGLNFNTMPGRGMYPTKAWRPGNIIEDAYVLLLQGEPTPGSELDLMVILYADDNPPNYTVEPGERLPVTVGGEAAGNALIVTRLKVPG